MQDDQKSILNTARSSLFLGMKLSKQASYSRRIPEASSLPHFSEANRLLLSLLNTHPDDREALIMLSQISECTMDYKNAILNLEKAFLAGEPKTKKLLKRLALLRECEKTWDKLILSPESLQSLGKHLEQMGVGPEHRTLQITRNWLSANVKCDHGNIISALEQSGAFTDFQVLANVCHG